MSCLDCGETVERGGIFERGQIEHCRGKSQAFGARRYFDPVHHHARWLHPRCWHCNADLGCPRCSGEGRELLCAAGLGEKQGKIHGGLGPVWATKAALLEHGLLRDQRIEDYPADWRPAYVRTISAAVGGRANISELVRQIAE